MNRLAEKTQTNATRIKIGESATASQNSNNNNNIILLRGAQSDGGHIILQNGQELLQLLNGGGEAKSGGSNTTTTSSSSSGKTIILQSPRLKQQSEANKNVKNRIMLHQTTVDQLSMANKQSEGGGSSKLCLSSQSLDSGVGETILLQTNGLSGKRISATTLSDGSILLHPRMMDSYTTTQATATGTSQAGNSSSDGPILLQTLKRFDKSIFVLRNSSGGSTAATAKPIIGATNMETSAGSLVSVVAENESPVQTPKKSGGSSARGGGSGAAKANVFNSKANNVIANGSNGGVSVRSNGISTRSSTGQQKQRGSNKGDSKKDSASAKQSNVPLGSGK